MESSVPSMQCCMASKGSFEELEASGFSEGLREGFCFFDDRRVQYVRGGQFIQFPYEFGTLGTVGIEKTRYVLDEFSFKLAYMSTGHRDLEERFDELMANATQSASSVSDPLKSKSEDKPWVG
ncbi:hypothetical protein L3X38_002948 [Prunus dulcis]|uniref:Uncharacterized protein n=1 Tax=Prunus dulcis TaxID=3755 RepID=A0AAD4WZW5_PRUDU|nr:hypothetical protein L3X38_002948 [Prunus dulcis]